MAVSAEAKAAMRANLELEVTARKEKLLAMCDAQCASLRSRLERRVNRVPSNKRTARLIDILEPPPPKKASPVRKLDPEAVTIVVPPVAVPVRAPAPAAAPSSKRSRPAATTTTGTTKTASKAATKATSKAATKTARTLKRTSDEISVDDKENNADLAVAKKRTKATAAPRATRATRAMSKKGDPPQVLSPKPNTGNARPATATRTRRVR